MTTSFSPYDWVHEVNPELKKLDTIPLTGAAPPFPWDQLSARLAQSLSCEGLTIQPGDMAWRIKEELYQGLGEIPFPLIFSIPTLRGTVCWVISEQEMAILEALLLTREVHPLQFQDRSLSESFRRFLALEVLYHLTQVPFDKTLIPLLTNQMTLPQEDSLCWEISLSLKGQTLRSRLILSPEFRESWIEYFAKQETQSALTQQMAQLVNVLVHLEVGSAHLSLEEWSAVEEGDFIPLDHYSLDPKRLEGRVMLTINGRRAFRAKLKEGNIKILELPLFHEVYTPMAKKPKDEDDLSEFVSNHEEEDEDFPEFDEDEELFEDQELFTEEELETEAAAPPHAAEEIPTEKAEEIEEAPVEPTSPALQRGPLTSDQIPVTLIVEVGQIQMTMDQLLKLEPGNLLELDIHPENGVDLTINGKVVAKGELIRVGETFGVRILQLGR